MAQENQYSLPHKERKKSGQAKSDTTGNATMRIEGANDPTDEKFPLVPKKPEQPQLPIDDSYAKLRTSQT